MCYINYRDDSKGKRKYKGKRYSESFDKYMYLWYVHVTNLDTTWVFWIKELNLTEEDFYCFQNGLHLSDRLINASQRLMKQHFKVHGLQNTLCGQNLTF